MSETEYLLQYGKTVASLDADDAARVKIVFDRIDVNEKKRISDRDKKASKKALVAAAAATAPVTPAVVALSVAADMTGAKKKRVKKEKGEVYQTVADTKRADINTTAGKKYCDDEISVHQKLLAAEINQNKNKVIQMQTYEIELIRRTQNHALHIINECSNMSAERKQQAINHLADDTKKQEQAAITRNNKTSRVLTLQEQLHKSHFQSEENLNTSLCAQKTALTKAYNEKKNSAFSHEKFSHIVNFTRLEKTHFDGEKDAALNSIYTNPSMYIGIPAHRARTNR